MAQTRHVVVTKFGNEPDLFGNDLRHGMIGDWEVTRLLQVLSSDKMNRVFYYGKAKWDSEKAKEYFENEVIYVDSALHSPEVLIAMQAVDEFHVLLGPHSYYNGGDNLPAWESIKKSLVTDRLLERVAPQIKMMNLSPNAKLFFYMTDRRFLLEAADLRHQPNYIYAQNLKSVQYKTICYRYNDYADIASHVMTVKPFRFDTLWLYGKDYNEYLSIHENQHRKYNLVISANQVTSDDEIKHSRLDKLKGYVEHIKHYTICGKWTHPDAIKFFKDSSSDRHFLEGLGLEDYNNLLRNSKYALVTFNTDDGPKIFDNNYLTPKYWECVYNGCLTFVERKDDYIPFIPEELQVKDGEELRIKLDKCEKDKEYKLLLRDLQLSLVKPEYFSNQYFTDFINNERERQC